MRTHALLSACAIALASTFAHTAQAQSGNYPNKPVRVILPYAPGGNTDISTRLIADQLSPKLGQPIIVESRPGAGGLVGVEAAVRSPADGYTIVMVGSALSTFPATVKNLNFDVIKDLAPITPVNSLAFLITVNPQTPIKSNQELISYAKANPDKLAVGYEGASTRLTIALFNKLAGTKMLLVPYKGGVAITTALLGNEVQVQFAVPLSVKGQIDAQKLRPIAVTSAQRIGLLPNVPTIAESGVPGYESIGWIGLLAPGGTPKDIVAKLNSEIVPILRSAAVKAKFSELGVDPMWSTPEEFSNYIGSEVRKWTSIAKEAGVVPE